MDFIGRRSTTFGTNGMVSSSQPIASEIGLRILQKGGNAADASIAISAALNVTQPASTGLGGDAFCLFYNNKDKTIKGINGSGRCPSGLSIDCLENDFHISSKDYTYLPQDSIHSITVPGAAACWVDTLTTFGTMTLGEVLSPAIELAEKGFPVSPVSAMLWKKGESLLKRGPHSNELLLNGSAPNAGEIMKNPFLGNSFRELVAHGKAGFYEGRIANEIIELIKSMGGKMTLEDLENHTSTMDTPISTNYRGIDIWEIPPNGQGITALMALNILEGFDLKSIKHNSPEYLHLLIESLRLAFADTRYYVADQTKTSVPIDEMLSKEYATKRRELISKVKAKSDILKGSPISMSNTVYFCVVDKFGNACSFINSNYMGFGSGLIPKGCGFSLQNRGANFNLEKDHPNILEGGKRPYHTIIPGLATKNNELWGPFGVMGGFMQPQGHVQVLLNMIDHNMDPQTALDAPRFLITEGTPDSQVMFEDGISSQTIETLSKMGHKVLLKPVVNILDRQHFGNGQIIRKDPKTGVLWAGSDPRADGIALGWV